MDSCNNACDNAPAPPIQGNGGTFTAYNAIRVTSTENQIGEGELTVSGHSLNHMGIVHGGCLAALADTVAGFTVVATTHRRCVTVNYAMNFLRPALGTNEKIYCRAVPRKLGRTLCVYGITLTDDEHREVATGDFTFFVNPDLVVTADELKSIPNGY